MKKIFLSMLVFAMLASPAVYANGGKKKARKKAKTECKKECKKDKCCDPKDCSTDDKCLPFPICTGAK